MLEYWVKSSLTALENKSLKKCETGKNISLIQSACMINQSINGHAII